LRGLPGAGRYLEIGVNLGRTIENVNVVGQRWGVDPNPQFDLSRLPKGLEIFALTSDEFFAQLGPDERFDVVFIDGLHTFEQTYTDLLNTLAHQDEGAVLIDDTVPCDDVSAMPDMAASFAKRQEMGLDGLPWHGDVWKVVACVARHHEDLEFRTIMGSGNPQTLLWRRHPGAEMVRAGDEAAREAAALVYAEVFADGVPSWFRPMGEQEALRDCLNAVAPRR
jgi:hypothetical protein